MTFGSFGNENKKENKISIEIDNLTCSFPSEETWEGGRDRVYVHEAQSFFEAIPKMNGGVDPSGAKLIVYTTPNGYYVPLFTFSDGRTYNVKFIIDEEKKLTGINFECISTLYR